MQTIVKILVALFFSHFTATEPVEPKKEEIAEVRTTIKAKSYNCPTSYLLTDNLTS